MYELLKSTFKGSCALTTRKSLMLPDFPVTLFEVCNRGTRLSFSKKIFNFNFQFYIKKNI